MQPIQRQGIPGPPQQELESPCCTWGKHGPEMGSFFFLNRSGALVVPGSSLCPTEKDRVLDASPYSACLVTYRRARLQSQGELTHHSRGRLEILYGGSVERGESERTRTWNKVCSECFAHIVHLILNQPTQAEGVNRKSAMQGGISSLGHVGDKGAGQGLRPVLGFLQNPCSFWSILGLSVLIYGMELMQYHRAAERAD